MQLIVACPLLRRLNLRNNSALSLQDLHMITSCCNLEGLNLTDVPIPRMYSSLIAVWKILSNIKKLAYLSIDTTYLGSSLKMRDHMHDISELHILLMQCRGLQALELSIASSAIYRSRTENDYHLLSHFPSLKYCRVIGSLKFEYFCVKTILNACKGLNYFYCHCSVQQSWLSQVHINNLQQLCMSLYLTDLDDGFMEAVSAHGGLVHVVFLVNSVNFSGITTLINNSPNLLTCLFGLHKSKPYCKWLNTELAKMFGHRRLFISGLSLVQQAEPGRLVKGVEWLQNTDLLTLWPPEKFIASDFPLWLTLSLSNYL